MSYSFSASGLPPGLSLVGNVVSGTPTTPGTYTVTLTVDDGVSSVSEVVTMTIAAVPVPVPFWQLILSAESGCYSRESYSLQFEATADSGSFWRDSFFLVPTITADSGSYWRDGAEAAIANTVSYWRDSFFLVPTITADSGSYWRDGVVSTPSVTVDSGSYWRESASVAIADSGSYWRDNVSLSTSDFMPYNLITTTTDVQLVKNNGYFLELSSPTASVNLKLPLSSSLTPGDRIEFYPSVGKANIQYNTGDAGFYYKDPAQATPKLVSVIPLDNNNIVFGLIWVDPTIGWAPYNKYDLTYTLYTAPASSSVYTASQSTVRGSSTAATYARMTDSDVNTGALTGNGAPSWIKATFPYPVTVTGVTVSGGFDPNEGNMSPDLNGSSIQYSTDNSTWTTIAAVPSITDNTSMFTVNFSSTTAQYWRISKASGYVATGTFKFLP